MSDNALPKGYEPRDVEARWRAHWESNRTFTPDPDAPGEPFSIVIPPPNVTGVLHMGHALNLTIQDILCRHARQKGKKVLWVPGTDHAGIATQNVVERGLAKEGKTRHDIGRETFIERVWAWREEYGTRILNQVRAMGASVDWTRERFTMDEGLSRAVRQVFVKLYNDGLIYKGDYIINWCNRCHTALSDDEVDHLPRRDHLWTVRYPLADGSGELVIATTRPETMFGDTAVCVHPEDERHAALVGKKVRLPLTDREIPVIADSYVDREFGTGALKVTPSHDHNDWELGHRHQLEFLQVIDEHGVMNAHAGSYAGLTKEECRKRVVADLAERGLLVKEEEWEHSVGHCYRCQSVIEPHVSTQWFVAARKMAQRARAAVPAATQIFPDNWEKTYYNWLDNIRDWCISRQIWWGHRIPAWTCGDCGERIVAVDAPERCACGSASLAQDEDVLDTWFSSALWPFSTMGWPDDTRELKMFYPTSVLVTGFDILFFWVARMMMLGLHFMNEAPFRHVYLHALVRDAEGRKMSKSSGNVIDPLVMIDKYGTDALRFTLAAFAAMGRDIRLSEERIEGYRHFVNKLWNAARFALMNLPGDRPPAPVDLDAVQGLHHRWILHRLEEVKEATDAAVTAYRFNDAAQGLYRFIWNEFCDWYLELVKPDMQNVGQNVGQSAGQAGESGDERGATARYVLLAVLRETLTLLHPIMPFVTAEIWAALPGNAGSDLAVQPFPAARPGCLKAGDAARMELVQDVIGAVRTIRAELNIAPSLRLTALVRTVSEHHRQVLEENRQMVLTLARLENAVFGPVIEAPRASASNVVSGNEVIVPLTGAVDFVAELARLDKELGKIEKDLVQVNKKLANESFVDKAPAEVVARERARADALADAKAKLEALQRRFREAIE